MSDIQTKLKTLLNDIEIIEKELLKSSERILKAGKSNIHKLDYFALSVINRAVSLNKGFKTLMETGNTLSAVSLLRLQLDNLIRYNALLISSNPLELINHVLDNKPINKYSENKQKFDDGYLAKELDKKFPNSSALYNHLCHYVHYGYLHIDYIFREKEIKSEKSSYKVIIGDCDYFSLKDKIDYTENMTFISINIITLMNQWAKDKDIFYS